MTSKHIKLPNVVVDPAKVQESGLIKDTILLDIPDEVGDFDTVVVRRATDKLKESSTAWAEYAKQQEEAHVVVPLMVLQFPNTPDPNEIGRALDTIFERYPELPATSVAHVFGEHTTQRFGNRDVPYIEPQRVQESTWVRIMIAKDAISTGWDCPRAEVMVSFRPAPTASCTKKIKPPHPPDPRVREGVEGAMRPSSPPVAGRASIAPGRKHE